MVVVGEREQPLHLARLELDELPGVGRALAADRHASGVLVEGRELRRLALLVEFGHDPMLDREAVAVPPRHEGAPTPLHELRPNHEVLEDLVHEVPDVDVSIGVGRTVMKTEDRGILPGCLDLRVEATLLPASRWPLAPSELLASKRSTEG